MGYYIHMSKNTTNINVTPEQLVVHLAQLFNSTASAEEESENSDDKREKLKKLAVEFKAEFSLKELKALLTEVAGVATVNSVPDDALDDVISELQADLSEEQNEQEEQDEPDVTPEVVKTAVQAFQKTHGKEETAEVLEVYGLTSLRGLNKLSSTQLENLFAEVT